jgi:hypothetical protein
VLYESDGRFRYEDHPLIAEAVYSAAPSGHSLVDSTWAERRADGRLYHRSHDLRGGAGQRAHASGDSGA